MFYQKGSFKFRPTFFLQGFSWNLWRQWRKKVDSLEKLSGWKDRALQGISKGILRNWSRWWTTILLRSLGCWNPSSLRYLKELLEGQRPSMCRYKKVWWLSVFNIHNFCLQVLSLYSPARDSQVRYVRLSDGYKVAVHCLMNSKINVKFLQNPIIRVIKWSMVSHNNTQCLHVTEFITVKNSVDFPLLGTPTNLLQSMKLLPTTTLEENVEKDGVLIPGRVLNNIMDKIMNNIKNHQISLRDDKVTCCDEPKS